MNRGFFVVFWGWLALAPCGCAAAKPPPPELLVFAAASTADALADIGHDFQTETGSPVHFSFGGSRDLARQILAGAPADAFVSADAATMDGLVAAGAVRAEDRRTLMSNRLVVIVPSDSQQQIHRAADLKNAQHLALGDPANVPAGTYAQHWLEKEGVWSDVKEHVVPLLDVRAALAAVASGQADMGIVYRTDATTSQRVRVAYEVPAEMSPTIAYVAARIAASTKPRAAEWITFLTGQKAHATFVRYGFVL